MREIIKGTEQQIEEYRNVVSVCCYFIGQIAKFAKMAEEHQDIDAKKAAYAAERVNLLIPLLLKRKEALGFHDGLDFLENNSFLGFKVIDGVFQGDKSAVGKVICPWLTGFPGKANHYQYEVSNYIHFLSKPDAINLYPKEDAISEDRRKKCRYTLKNWWSSVQEVLGLIS